MGDTFVSLLRRAFETELEEQRALHPGWWVVGHELRIEIPLATDTLRSLAEFLSAETAQVPFIREIPIPPEDIRIFRFYVTRRNEFTIRQWLTGLENRMP